MRNAVSTAVANLSRLVPPAARAAMSFGKRTESCDTLYWPAAAILFAACFWTLRYRYWSITLEEPFSDMADYINVGRQIHDHFFFAVSEQLYAYYTPITPSLLAISMALGEGRFIAVFRVLIQLITFTGTLLLAYEIAALTGRKWLGAALLFVVAFSRPSIFWSLKPSTETASEAFLLLSIGLCLCAYRTRSCWMAGACGVTCMLLALNRPQFLPAALFLGFLFLLSAFFLRRPPSTPFTNATDAAPPAVPRPQGGFPFAVREWRRFIQALCFGVGLVLVWAPWLARNYLHYHAIIPTSTSGMDSIIFDYAGAPIHAGRYTELPYGDNQVLRVFDYNKIRESFYPRMNDFEVFKAEGQIAVAWLKANVRDFPRLVLWRLKTLIAERGASGLSHVSREVLFPVNVSGWNYSFTQKSWLDLVLVDKSPWIVLLGFAGAIIFALRYGMPGCMLASLAVLPWLGVALVFSYERAVEPMTAITAWLALYCLADLLHLTRSRGNA
jgi:hypothetical protein